MRKRNVAQKKEQGNKKAPEKELNKMETNNVLDAEFKHCSYGSSVSSVRTSTA